MPVTNSNLKTTKFFIFLFFLLPMFALLPHWIIANESINNSQEHIPFSPEKIPLTPIKQDLPQEINDLEPALKTKIQVSKIDNKNPLSQIIPAEKSVQSKHLKNRSIPIIENPEPEFIENHSKIKNAQKTEGIEELLTAKDTQKADTVDGIVETEDIQKAKIADHILQTDLPLVSEEIALDEYEESFESAPYEKSEIPNIELYTNLRIEAFIRMYTNRKRYAFEQAIDRKPIYWDMMTKIFREYGLPDNLVYLSIVESNLNPKARSSANALGIWQFMRPTGRMFSLYGSWWHDDRYDPVKSTHAAAKYLKKLKGTFGDWERALAAYNSGPGTVRKAIRRAKRQGKSTDYWSLKLPRETRGYVPAFFAVTTIFSDLESFDFDPEKPWQGLESIVKNTIIVPGGVSFQHISNALNINSKLLEKLNPALTKGMTPANKADYKLFIPTETVVETSSLESLKKHRQQFWKTHKIRSGDTLWAISMDYRIPIRQIRSFNRLRKKNILRIGRKLMLPVPSSWKPIKREKHSYEVIVVKNQELGYNHTYVVKNGDTLWDISQRFNISLRTLKNWNRRIRHRRLKVGSFLRMKLPLKVAQST